MSDLRSGYPQKCIDLIGQHEELGDFFDQAYLAFGNEISSIARQLEQAISTFENQPNPADYRSALPKFKKRDAHILSHCSSGIVLGAAQ